MIFNHQAPDKASGAARAFGKAGRAPRIAGLAATVAIVALGFAINGHVGAQERAGRQDVAQVTIGEALAYVVQVRGRVADIFGDRILIEDETGRILVEVPAGLDKPADIAVGRTIEVEGRLRGRTIEARRIVLTGPAGPAVAAPAGTPPSGAVPQRGEAGPAHTPAQARPSSADALLDQLARPADAATIRMTLEGIGLRAAGAPVRKNKNTEILARDAAGKAWTASLDRFGRLEEIELEDYDDDNAPSRPNFDDRRVTRIVEEAGYRTRASVERRSDHFEVIALNQQGDLVEVHVDFAGTIYKVEWVR